MMKTSLYQPKQLSVLVLDDHEPMRKGIKRVLIHMGFESIFETSDAAEAQRLLNENPIDLLISDIYLRRGSGLDVLRDLRGRNLSNDIPVIVLTGEASKDEIVKASHIGADEYLLKPFQSEDLEKKITKVLTAYHSPLPLVRLLRHGERQTFLKNYPVAIQSFEAALKIDDNSVRARHGIAMAMAGMGKVQDAINLLDENIQKSPTFYKNFATMADIYVESGNTQNAIRALRSELELNPKQINRQLLMARLLLDEGDNNGAIVHFREALKEDPKHRLAMFGLGKAFAVSDNLDKALHYFARIRRMHPTDRKPLEAIVKYCVAAGEPKKAEMMLRDERRAHPERQDVHVMLAKFYIQQDREEDGLKVTNELLVRNPEQVEALKILAALHVKNDRIEEALIVYRKLVGLESSLAVYLPYGETLLKAKKYGEAIGCLIRALSFNKKSPRILFLLAEAHKETKQICKAHLLFRRAAALGWQGPEALKEANMAKIGIRARHSNVRKLAS